MRDHRRGGEVEPEGDVRAPGPALAIGHVPAHREGEHRDAGDQQQRTDRVAGGRDDAERSAPITTPTTATAPAATVIGTMKRRQCSHAAPARSPRSPRDAPTTPSSCRLATGVRAIDVARRSAPISVAATPPTKASSSRMLGSAMRRWRVKYSASPQAPRRPAPPPSGAAIRRADPRRPRPAAARSRSTTKMSLKPVSSRKCSSSTAGVGRARGDVIAQRRGGARA